MLKMKNIAVEFNTRLITATQASSVDPQLLNDPKFVMTRYNVSEFKNIAEPFSYFFTLNQTKDEYINNLMRIYIDKCRKYKGGQTVTIHTNYSDGCFYDAIKTRKEGLIKIS
jgi:hypothetical protein